MSYRHKCSNCWRIFWSDIFDDKYCSTCEKAMKIIISEFLEDYEEIREGLVGVNIPYNVIIKINSLKEKWEKMIK